MQITELNPTSMQQLLVPTAAAGHYAARQHLLNLRAHEIGRVLCDLPVFFSRASNGQYLISALCSFVPGQNLWVQQAQWQALYQPMCLQTYPLFLLGGPDAATSRLGIDLTALQSTAATAATSTATAPNPTLGEALFDSRGQPTLYLSRQRALLEADVEQDFLTYQFCRTLVQWQLLKAVDLVLQMQDGSLQTIQGLATVDEDKLASLSAAQLAQLQQQGYLALLHGILMSIYQLNALIRRHNQRPELPAVKTVRLELSRSVTAG